MLKKRPSGLQWWKETFEPWMSEFYRSPFGTHRKDEMMRHQRGVYDAAQGMELPPKLLAQLRLPNDPSKIIPRDILGLVVFERLFADSIFQVLKGDAKNYSIHQSLMGYFSAFAVFERATYAMHHAVCYSFTQRKAEHIDHRNSSDVTCFCCDPRNIFFNPNDSISDIAFRCWSQTVHREVTQTLMRFARENLVKNFREELYDNVLLSKMVDVLRLLGDCDWFVAMLDSLFIERCRALRTTENVASESFCVVAANRLMALFSGVSSFASEQMTQRLKKSSLAEIVAPFVEHAPTHFAGWVQWQSQQQLEAVYYFYCLQREVSPSSQPWLAVWFRDALAGDLSATLKMADVASDVHQWFAAVSAWRAGALHLVSRCFKGDPLLRRTVDDAARIALYASTWEPAYVLHLSCSERGTISLEQATELVRWLLEYKILQNIDMFFSAAQAHCEFRLLDPGRNLHDEETIVRLLKPYGGAIVARQLECAMRDIKLSDEVSQKLPVDPNSCSLSLCILSPSCWKSVAGKSIVLPSFAKQMSLMLRKAEKSYCCVFPHRVLKWNHQKSFVTVDLLRTYFSPKSPREIVLPLLGALVLLAFDHAPQQRVATGLTTEELSRFTGLPPGTIAAFIHEFTKKHILMESETKDQRYLVNRDISQRQRKLSMMPKLRFSRPSAASEEARQVEEQRHCMLQSAIIRVLKANRELEHEELMKNVILQLQTRFCPSVTQIKRVLELLLEKEYVQRKEGSRSTYQYIA